MWYYDYVCYFMQYYVMQCYLMFVILHSICNMYIVQFYISICLICSVFVCVFVDCRRYVLYLPMFLYTFLPTGWKLNVRFVLGWGGAGWAHDFHLHLHTSVPLRYWRLSCACTHVSDYATEGSLALAHMFHTPLVQVLCICTHTWGYATVGSLAFAEKRTIWIEWLSDLEICLHIAMVLRSKCCWISPVSYKHRSLLCQDLNVTSKTLVWFRARGLLKRVIVWDVFSEYAEILA